MKTTPRLGDEGGKIMKATYSPEDNKLRLYPDDRLEPDLYQRVKAAGFIWAPKQKLFVAPLWTPGREDLLVELCGEVEDEDTSLAERAEERAERFETYSENRAKDADTQKDYVKSMTDHIPFGQPILVGHHSEKRARKIAQKIENGMSRAVKLWEQSKYWEDRAKGAIRHAKYKERPDVRARRIKKIEAEKRKAEKVLADCKEKINHWLSPVMLTMGRAKFIANNSFYSQCFKLSEYPRDESKSQYEGDKSLWSALDDGIITAKQARNIHVPVLERTIKIYSRWVKHYKNRLLYEKTMLQEQGGIASDRVKPEKGGAIRCWCSPREGWSYIQKVNKVSVTVLDNWNREDSKNFTRNIKLTDIKHIMTADQVQKKRDAGYLTEVRNGIGFILRDEPVKEPYHKKEEQKTEFDDMKETLQEGIKTVSAPQLFPTPPELAKKMVEIAKIENHHNVLEPSAGTGNIIKAIGDGPDKTAIEINSQLVNVLMSCASGLHVIEGDFLQMNGDLGTFDRVVMNPPFINGSDIKHIQHALTFLKPGGRLVALCANGPRQREQLKPISTAWEDLPEGSFKAAGTNVNTALLAIDN